MHGFVGRAYQEQLARWSCGRVPTCGPDALPDLPILPGVLVRVVLCTDASLVRARFLQRLRQQFRRCQLRHAKYLTHACNLLHAGGSGRRHRQSG